MSESLITRSLVETAVARVGKTLDPKFTDEYFAALCLRGGKGKGFEEGDRCSIQEERAWLGLDASVDDVPGTDSLPIGKFLIRFQDSISGDALRTKICAPFLLRQVGSKGSGAVEKKRAWIAADWAIREVAVIWAEQHDDLKEWADKLRALPPIQSPGDVENARVTLDAFRSAAWKLRESAVASLSEKIKAELAKRGFADADAAADADAVADAVAAAAAVADAVADAAAAADAVAAADADAVADAVAVADADAAAVAENFPKCSNRWWLVYSAARKAIREKLTSADFGERYQAARVATWESGAKCVERMLAVNEASL